MKRKNIIILIIIGVLLVGALIAFSIIKNNARKKEPGLNDVVNIIQPVYGALVWADLCDDNGIEYSKESLEKIKSYYKTISNAVNKEDCNMHSAYLYALCIDRFIGIEDSEYLSLFNEWYDDSEGLYEIVKDSTATNKYLADLEHTTSCALIVYRHNITGIKDIDSSLVQCVNSYLYEDKYIGDDQIITSLLYILWDYNKADGIDLRHEKIKNLYQRISDNILETAKTNGFPSSIYFSASTYIPLWKACGIDTSEYEEYLANYDVLSDDISEWNYWNEMSLFSGHFVPSIYYRVLKGGNAYFKNNKEFTESFGNGLTRYLDEILIPEMELYMTQLKISF